MIVGTVTADDVPIVKLDVAGRTWDTLVDTGFDGDLELPISLKASLNATHRGKVICILAAGQTSMEEGYNVILEFDGQTVLAEVTFVAQEQILLGTRMLRRHRLEIDFPNQSVRLERTA